MRRFAALTLAWFGIAPPAAAQTETAIEVGPAAAAVVAEGAAADADPADGVAADGLRLSDLLARAADHPLVEAALAGLDVWRARLVQAQAAPWSNFQVSAGLTFVPPLDWDRTDYSDDLRFRDTSILDWGPAMRVEFSGVIPIYEFGKYWGLAGVAEAGIRVGEAGVETARDRVTWEVRRAYLSLMAAREFLYLIDEGRGHLDDAQREIARRLERGDPGAERVDLYRLEAATAEVDVRELQARRLERIALEGLRLLAGLDPAEVIADVPLEPYPLEADSLDGYRELARARRPEIRMVEAGIEAQRRRRRVEWGRWFPDFGLAVSASWVYTAGVDDMHDPKVYDPYNTAGVGAALVMSYPLDFGMDYGRVSEADAEIRRLEAEREALVQAVSVEVVEAWAGLEEASGRMAAQERARTAGRRWFITILQGMTLGLHDAAALTDGLVTYFKGEFEYLSAVYDFNLSWSRLARATGADLLGGLDP